MSLEEKRRKLQEKHHKNTELNGGMSLDNNRSPTSDDSIPIDSDLDINFVNKMIEATEDFITSMESGSRSNSTSSPEEDEKAAEEQVLGEEIVDCVLCGEEIPMSAVEEHRCWEEEEEDDDDDPIEEENTESLDNQPSTPRAISQSTCAFNKGWVTARRNRTRNARSNLLNTAGRNRSNRGSSSENVRPVTNTNRMAFNGHMSMRRSARGSSIGTSHAYNVRFTAGGKTILCDCSGESNAKDIKQLVLDNADEEWGEEGGYSKDITEYILQMVGFEAYITNESLPLHRVRLLQVCRKSFILPQFRMIRLPSKEELESNKNLEKKLSREIKINTEIYELIGDSLKKILASENSEINSFRKNITKQRMKINQGLSNALAAETNDDMKYNTTYLPQYRESEPLPMILPDKLTFVCYLPGENEKKSTISCALDEQVSQLRQKIFKNYRRKDLAGSEGKGPEDFVVKVTGCREYLLGDHPVSSYDYIRKCISKKSKMELSLVPIEEVDLNMPKEVEESLVDAILASPDYLDLDVDEESLSIQSISSPFKLRVESISKIDKATIPHEYKKAVAKYKKSKGKVKYYLFMVAGLYHGDVNLVDEMWSQILPNSNTLQLEEDMLASILVQNIPRAARLSFTLYRRPIIEDQKNSSSDRFQKQLNEKLDIPLAWVNVPIMDHKGRLRQGECRLKLWPGKGNPIGTCVDNVVSKDPPVLRLKFPTYASPVVFPRYHLNLDTRRSSLEEGEEMEETSRVKSTHSSFADDRETVVVKPIRERIAMIGKKDPLMTLNKEEQDLLWEYRMHCSSFPELLPWFLEYVKWNDSELVKEAYRMLQLWKPPSPFDALQLLDAKFASPVVREYAVNRLQSLGDRECADFLLQLTQVLKYEPYHDSPLANFLLTRALKNKNLIGHAFFWHMKSEMHNPTIASRNALLTEAYLRGCGTHREDLLKQNRVQDELAHVAHLIKRVDTHPARKKVLLAELAKLKFPSRFQLPLDPRKEVTGLTVDKCKYMDSKKLPLWLVMKNVERSGGDVYVIFKAGDDLRQDVLTLQMLKIMDKLWKQEGLDLRLNAYGCVATGDELGMIEVVLNAATTASINKAAGGGRAVLYKDTLSEWLKKNNPSEDEYAKAVENFMLTCAGYCVATYVLGIGDRHNDNIMMTKKGHLFHIDFGHFLGNVKSKYGIKRERAPFIFNPQFAHILGGRDKQKFNEFVKLCGRAYNILRKQANMFINLFMMMLSTGIPELQRQEDIEPLKEALSLEKTDEEAAEHFERLIHQARKTKTVLFNDMIHIWAH